MALWEGRFKKELDKRTNDFNSSIKFDSRMYIQDIKGSIAHSKMLDKQGIISKQDGEEIEKELETILQDMNLRKVRNRFRCSIRQGLYYRSNIKYFNNNDAPIKI